jgi:hypothetical protein
MSGSSARRKSAFENVKWAHVQTLLELLRDREFFDERQLRRLYQQTAIGYAEVIVFLMRIGLVSRSSQRIACNQDISGDPSQLGQLVIHHILRSDNPYRVELFRYLRRFRINSARILHRADASSRSKESAVRNFLMGLGIVTHEPDGDRHLVSPAHSWLYAQARTASRRYSPAQLTSLQARRDEIGFAAERAVVESEESRLGPLNAHHVEHISLLNAAAGYDVLSATETKSGVAPRYIEVKAVPRQTYRFFWTHNEVQVASVLGPLYYLYLVPIASNGKPSMAELLIVADPHSAVLDGENFIVEPNVCECRPKSLTAVENVRFE